MARLEHANINVGDTAKTAAWFGRAFGWRVRWEGSTFDGAGYTMHVGNDDDYLALYEPKASKAGGERDYKSRGQLNHVGIVVDDLAVAEKAIRAEGYEPHSHQDYEPGERFYFCDENGIEYEIVAYA
ncbi:catechol 2,3-dioxygenase-like lactoylglutathione lyase family enzyme [Planktotalea frisia]|jgi:catechol 2,3-dioxygenase-like lactoylglutathione lyase family enzyme|uniref:Glyoxalase/bleomycin resistance protein/dioxygenase superfamily protein n=1 Tax=Planktotalea frisia TaxID=696762 RepID=A0A1L9NX09_9RHOB|nr:glyoxalase/bleomycin resistance protein/dioxygenase superfamily protein [Planktotalea frisia]PZX30881.1 catechol 2,3-dioxygenase-like lactoylglutathione lyase family enzyme [Planktotalea frisia]